ncbi:sigma-70 family RNA polymerase sigma factor [Paenibacillus baekrokdamisoli]|nr:sigma-70 family RNA polymerase sigma factor [Paenibacillus baekrokdamisoli]
MKALIYQYGLRMSNDSWEAEDLTQDTLLKVHRILEANPLKQISKAYLFRAVSNAWKDKWKRNKGHLRMLDNSVPEVSINDEGLTTRELLEVLAHRLSPRSMVILLLRDVFDFTAKETAIFLSSTEDAVQVALSRARVRLKKIALQSKVGEDRSGSNDSSEQWLPRDFDELVYAFRRRDPKAICRAYVGLAKRRVRISRLLWVNGKLAFYMEDPDGNRFMITE